MAFTVSPLKSISWRLAATFVLSISGAGGFRAQAEDLMLGKLPIKNVTIQAVEGDKLIYKTQSGTASDKTITDSLRVTVADEPNLTVAEEAFANEKWSDAVDGYQKTLRSTSKPWLKDFAAIRLLKAGERSNRFDGAVTAYIHLLAKDPKAAQEMKLKYPDDPANAYLKTAASQVDTALATEKDTTKQTSLTVFRMNIAKAMHDEPTVLKLAGELSKSLGTTSTGTLDPTVLAGITDGKLNLILSSVEKKDFPAALKGLEQVKPSVTEPKHQAEWLWLTAESNAGAAGDTKDGAVLRNLAIDYMRVVANFPASPHAGESLLKTGAILEKLNDPKAALAVYQQIARDFNDQPVGSEAKKSVVRLGGK